MKIFLPQRNRAVYNGLYSLLREMKIFYHGLLSHEYLQPLIFPKLRYVTKITWQFTIRSLCIYVLLCYICVILYEEDRCVYGYHLYQNILTAEISESFVSGGSV